MGLMLIVMGVGVVYRVYGQLLFSTSMKHQETQARCKLNIKSWVSQQRGTAATILSPS